LRGERRVSREGKTWTHRIFNRDQLMGDDGRPSEEGAVKSGSGKGASCKKAFQERMGLTCAEEGGEFHQAMCRKERVIGRDRKNCTACT